MVQLNQATSSYFTCKTHPLPPHATSSNPSVASASAASLLLPPPPTNIIDTSSVATSIAFVRNSLYCHYFRVSSFHRRGRGPQLPPPLVDTSEASSTHNRSCPQLLLSLLSLSPSSEATTVVCRFFSRYCHPKLPPPLLLSFVASSVVVAIVRKFLRHRRPLLSHFPPSMTLFSPLTTIDSRLNTVNSRLLTTVIIY